MVNQDTFVFKFPDEIKLDLVSTIKDTRLKTGKSSYGEKDF